MRVSWWAGEVGQLAGEEVYVVCIRTYPSIVSKHVNRHRPMIPPSRVCVRRKSNSILALHCCCNGITRYDEVCLGSSVVPVVPYRRRERYVKSAVRESIWVLVVEDWWKASSYIVDKIERIARTIRPSYGIPQVHMHHSTTPLLDGYLYVSSFRFSSSLTDGIKIYLTVEPFFSQFEYIRIFLGGIVSSDKSR